MLVLLLFTPPCCEGAGFGTPEDTMVQLQGYQPVSALRQRVAEIHDSLNTHMIRSVLLDLGYKSEHSEPAAPLGPSVILTCCSDDARGGVDPYPVSLEHIADLD